MAKGSKGRTYNRDARGRFASGSSGGPAIRRGALKAGGGTAKTRGSLGRSKAKLSAKQGDSSYSGTLSRRAQKGAVTRGKKALQQAKKDAQVRLNIGPKKGVIAKPKGLKSGALAEKRKRSKAKPVRTAEEQARRDLIARGLKKLPKEKRARAIALRRQMEGRMVAPGEPKPRLTQKERWLLRADVYERAAQRNLQRISEIEAAQAPFRGDVAFNTQPGRIPFRERMLKQQERAFELRKKAKAQLQRARELRQLATTNKGDAERKRQQQRDAVNVEKGARIKTMLYGPGEIVRVNKKTVSYYSEQTGSIIKVDKSWIMPQ